MITFNTMKTELKARLGNRIDLDARMIRWINYAFFELLMNPRFQFFEMDFKITFDTVIGQSEYPISTIIFGSNDLWFILDLRDNTNDRKLRRSHWSYLDKVVPQNGQPVRYYRFGLNVVLDPTPDGVYTMQMRYRVRPPDLREGSQFFGLKTEWEEPIVTLAAVKAFEALKLHQDAAIQRQLLELMLTIRSDVPSLEDFDSENGVEVAMIPRY